MALARISADIVVVLPVWVAGRVQDRIAVAAADGPLAPAPAQAVKGDHEAPSTGVIDLNPASAATLQALPKVGPVLAQRIIDARPLRRVEDLLEIQGVGTLVFVGGEP